MNEDIPVFESGTDGTLSQREKSLLSEMEKRYPKNDPILEKMEEVLKKNIEIVTKTDIECDVIIVKPTSVDRNPPKPGDIEYFPANNPATDEVKIILEERGRYPTKVAHIKADKILTLARAIQHQKITKDEDLEEVDHKQIVEDIEDHLEKPSDDAIQVFEGDASKVMLDQFTGATAQNILDLIHFIEANSLQERRPWCVVWNIYKCLTVALDRD